MKKQRRSDTTNSFLTNPSLLRNVPLRLHVFGQNDPI